MKRRKFFRAPFFSFVLYQDLDHIFKAKALNLSLGGMLLESVPFFPKSNRVNLLISVPCLPNLHNKSIQEVAKSLRYQFPKKVLKTKGGIIRKNHKRSLVDNLFSLEVALEFDRLETDPRSLVGDYVDTYASNLAFLLNLLENANSDDETVSKARMLAEVLGYPKDEKLSILHMLVKQDYRSGQS